MKFTRQSSFYTFIRKTGYDDMFAFNLLVLNSRDFDTSRSVWGRGSLILNFYISTVFSVFFVF